MNSPPSSRHLEQLFQDLEDATISSEDFKELMVYLNEDPSIRLQYRSHMEFVSILQAKADELYDREGLSLPLRSAFPRKKFILALGSFAALVVLSLSFLSERFSSKPSLVSISPSSNADWYFTEGGIAPDQTDFLPHSTIRLNQGTLDIDLGNQTHLLLEGPAELRIQSPEEIDLPYGRVWARADGDTFIVNTSSLRILDLGTEFGVSASPDLDEEVHVAKGRVRISPFENEQHFQEYTGGSAARVDQSGFVRSIPYQPSNFLTKSSQGIPYIHWSFDQTEERALPSQQESLSPADLFVYHFEHLNKPLEPTIIPGRFGGALHLDQPDHFARASFPGISGNLPRTVTLWVKAHPQFEVPASFLISWGLPTEFGTKWALTLKSDPYSILGTGWGGSWASTPAGSKTPTLFDDQWHHLAYVFSGRLDGSGIPIFQHYLDGDPLPVSCDSAQPVNTDCQANNSWPLTIGTQIFTNSFSPSFEGAIDELYIFRAALTAEQIRALYLENSLFAPKETLSAE